MGGPGSGRWYRWQGICTTLEEVYRLDVRWLHRHGYLDGRSHWVTWSRGEQQAGSLLLALQPEGVVLTYRCRVGGGDWESVRQVVTLAWTPCYYGGERPGFGARAVVDALRCSAVKANGSCVATATRCRMGRSKKRPRSATPARSARSGTA
jgi:hypothetical protein